MEMWGLGGDSGGGEKSLRRELRQSSPYTAAIQEIRRQIAQTGAQTQQNIADVHSWFNQYAGQLRGAAKGNRKAGKRAVRSQARETRGLLGSGLIGDAALAREVGAGARDERRYLRNTNQAEGRFDRRMIADAARQEAYQALVQSRLGAQAQADLGAKLSGLRQQRSSAIQEAMSSQGDDEFSRWATIMNMLPQDTRAQLLGLPGEAQDPQDALEFEWKMRDRLGEAMSGITPAERGKDDSGEAAYSSSYGNFNELLDAYRQVARGAGLNLDDPAVREWFRNYIASKTLEKWNPYAEASGKTPMRRSGYSFVPR
jgi:hypothetical protein